LEAEKGGFRIKNGVDLNSLSRSVRTIVIIVGFCRI
jgi:hypothetical protein